MRELSGRAFNIVMRVVTGLHFRDTQCGFKLFRKDAAQVIFSRQQEEGFSFDVEDLLIAHQLGLRSIEVAVEWSNVEGTKVSLVQGIRSFADLARIRARALRGDYK
jgi:dolichyl-phosphate beta-glucosyltransferase